MFNKLKENLAHPKQSLYTEECDSKSPQKSEMDPDRGEGEGPNFKLHLCRVKLGIYDKTTCMLTLLYLSSQGKMRTRPAKRVYLESKKIMHREYLDPSHLAFCPAGRQPCGRTHSIFR